MAAASGASTVTILLSATAELSGVKNGPINMSSAASSPIPVAHHTSWRTMPSRAMRVGRRHARQRGECSITEKYRHGVTSNECPPPPGVMVGRVTTDSRYMSPPRKLSSTGAASSSCFARISQRRVSMLHRSRQSPHRNAPASQACDAQPVYGSARLYQSKQR